MSSPSASPAFNTTHAEAYDRQLEPLLPAKAAIHALVRAAFAGLPANARILVAGAGTAAEARFLAPLFPGWRFVLVDPSAAMLDVALRHAAAEGFADRCVAHVGLLATLPDAPFDAATSILVSHFLTDPAERQAYYDAIAHRLLPGGLLFQVDLCADPAHLGPLMDLWVSLVSMPPDREAAYRAGFGTGVAAHGPAEVEGMLDRAGFAATPCFQSALIRGWLAKRR